ncbi:hypothetical protein LR066_02240 [candidate division WOR-3 bacterium]|nr:hypothetical protein [candidate division WOR-3 bacterium]
MNIPATSKSRIEQVVRAAVSIWRHNRLSDMKRKILEIGREEFTPLYDFENEPLSCAVFGSGSFSTGRQEIYIAKEIEKVLGWAPVRYTLIVTNNRKSKAKEVADEFRLPLVEMDFSSWYRENYNPSSMAPIKETTLFGQKIDRASLIQRFNIRKEFDIAQRERIEKVMGLPELISLRGYNFPLIHTLLKGDKRLIDDTHPADLSLTDREGVPLCPGWQTGAVEKMINCGHRLFRSSLIGVRPFFSISDVLSIDTGILYALSPGIRADSSWSAGKIQETMKQTEDYFLCALKGSGLFPYLWGKSKTPQNVEYITASGEIVIKKEPSIVVLDKIRSGRNAFGRNIRDLND